MCEWEIVSLGDVAETRNGAGITQSHFSELGVPLARVTDFTDSSIDLSDCLHVEPEHAKQWKGHILKEGDVVVATVGSWPPNWASVVGKAIRVPRSAAGAIQNQNTCCVMARPGSAEQRFLFYLLRSKSFVLYASNAAGGSANQARLPVANLKKFEFAQPTLAEQRRIAHILGTLDDKIELNRRMNRTLEAVARAIFKSWFIDFDPVHAKAEGREPVGMDPETAALFPDSFQDSPLGKIPKGWEARTVDSLCARVENGGTPKRKDESYWDGGIPWYKTGELRDASLISSSESISALGLENSSCKLWPPGTILIALYASPTVGRLGLLTEPSAANQACSGLIAEDPFEVEFLFHSMLQTREQLQRYAVGAAQQNISQIVVREHLLVTPSENLLRVFGSRASVFRQQQITLLRQSAVLELTRDSLLPKLLSGQLDTGAAKRRQNGN